MLKVKEIHSTQRSESTIADEIERSPTALTVRDLTKLWQVSDETVYRLATSGVLPHFRIGGSLRFDPRQVAMWLRSRSIGV